MQVCPCPEPTPCYQPVLPCCNPQCPPPIIPKQRPICPRAPPCPYPCLPVCRSCCPHCELDPVTRRRPLIVHDSVFHTRKTGLPAECFTRTSPNIRYKVENYVRQVCALYSYVIVHFFKLFFKTYAVSVFFFRVLTRVVGIQYQFPCAKEYFAHIQCAL